MFYTALADAIVAFHGCYVGFVVVGQLLIMIGLACRWQWVRNPWFRWLHLLAILVVAVEASVSFQCPLTTWERNLRELAGEETSKMSFVGRLFNSILFYDIDEDCEAIFSKFHMGFGVLVLLTFLLFPPRFRRAKAAPAPATPEPAPAVTASLPEVPSHAIEQR